MKTSATERLGIELPIIQAPMGGAAGPELVAAVSEAGGLGVLPLSWASPDEARRQIRAARVLTEKPFAINLVLARPQAERLAACLEEGARIVSFFWGDPGTFTDQVHAAGGLVMETVASAAEARAALGRGADIVVAQGWEAGGHVKGEVATLPLTRSVIEAGEGAPVIAAGGIADGRGLAAVLALGAAGAWIGTRFLAAREAVIHPDYRRRLLEAAETDTVHTGLFDIGWPDAPHRVLVNSTWRAWDEAGRPATGNRPGEGERLGEYAAGVPIVRYASATPAAGSTGKIEAMSMWAGQGVGLVRREQGAGEIVREIAAEARAAIRELGALA
ncbi:MAG TPA: nitronate monooxygenase [Caulobacteraceae bacterium]|nr:nitronate monooxygenase [Caulobacteraceae bacterium]